MTQQHSLPLQNVRVLDLTTTIYGPYTTQILGDFGADVIKIESPLGDPVRNVGPSRSNGMGALFLGANRNKRGVVLDLKSDVDKAAFWDLIKGADILVHNMRPTKMDALGFGPKQVLKVKPDIVYAGLYGYGATGPYAERPAYDDVIQGLSGISALFTLRDGVPAMIPSIAVDKGAATMAASGILAAYIQRLTTGAGVVVECPMFEAMVSFNLVEHQYGAIFQPPLSSYGYPRMLSPHRRPHRTKDGYLCLLAYTDKQWMSFWPLTSRPELAEDQRFKTMKSRSEHIDLVYEAAAQEILARPTQDWLDLFEQAQIPAGPVNTLEDVRQDPHLNAVGFFRPFEHPTEGPMEIPDTPYRFDGASLPVRHGQPRLGADTATVLREAGVAPDQIKDIVARLKKD